MKTPRGSGEQGRYWVIDYALSSVLNLFYLVILSSPRSFEIFLVLMVA
jgi:hypothetical protein